MHTFFSTQSLITNLSHSHRFAARFREYRLQQQWATVVGAQVAAHTWPDSIRFHTVHVAVDTSVWLHQLMYLKATVMENVRAAMPDLSLRDIVFRLGDIPPPRPPARDVTTTPRIRVSPEARRAAAACARGVGDRDLRDTLTRVIATALSAANPDREP